MHEISYLLKLGIDHLILDGHGHIVGVHSVATCSSWFLYEPTPSH